MSEELKPVRCGCGGEAEIIKHTFHKLSPSYGIECTNCHTESWQFYNTEAEAIRAWNLAMGAKDIHVGNKIIYCKDCKYSHMTIDGLCKYCDIWFPNEEMYEDGNHFCASAEKR